MTRETQDEQTLLKIAKRVDACADAHTEHLGDLSRAGRLRAGEAESLEAFSGFLAPLLEMFNALASPTASRAPERSPSPGADRHTPEAQWRTLVSALLAAEVETNGKFRMRRAAIMETATILETIGAGFRDSGLPLHAAHAFALAADQYRLLRDAKSESRSLLAETRARHAALPHDIRKIAGFFADQVSGFGYLPYRMFRLIVAQLALYSLIVWSATPRTVDSVRALESILLNYLNPMGPDPDFRGLGNALLVADSYSGCITLAVFFAMLVRRW